jgi:hypothetical protein
MSPAPTLDDLERDIARTLRTKADQLAVDTSPFPRTAVGHVESIRVETPRSRRRRGLAVAAVLALLAGSAAVARAWGSDAADTAGTDTAGAPEAWLDETVAFGLDEQDWHLSGVHVTEASGAEPARWQLFGARDEVPVARGLLVGTVEGRWSVPPSELAYTIHGHRGTIGRRLDASVPPGTIEAVWGVGEVWYRALAVGVTDTEMLATLESLVPRDDPATGFDPPADGSLGALGDAQPRDAGGSYATYTGADGDLVIDATPVDAYGGLLHRLAGTPTDGGIVLASDAGDGSGAARATLLRDDGWTVTVAGDIGLSAAALRDLAHGARPLARRDVIAWGVGRPVTGGTDVGEWTVRVHGTEEADTAVCVAPPSGEEACSTAEASFDVTTASVPAGDEWIVVTVTNAPDRSVVRRAPDAAGVRGDTLEGELGRWEGRLVQLTVVPDGVDAVVAGSWDAGGATYTRPQG